MTQIEEPERRIGELNWLGKAVFLAGTGIRYTADFLDSTLVRIVEVVSSTEKAFKQGLDPNIEEARIVEEKQEMKSEVGSRKARRGVAAREAGSDLPEKGHPELSNNE